LPALTPTLPLRLLGAIGLIFVGLVAERLAPVLALGGEHHRADHPHHARQDRDHPSALALADFLGAVGDLRALLR